MKLFKTKQVILLKADERFFLIEEPWDELLNRKDLFGFLSKFKKETKELTKKDEIRQLLENELLAPAGQQEVWAAGVTYQRSRQARMEESNETGGADFYDKVYEAERPELFFKSLPHRLAGHGQEVYIRRDSAWNVPEPELTLFINSSGQISAYTIGNDMSSRSIEGENPLYLPQAKVYEKSAAIGPCLYIPETVISPETMIEMAISRNGEMLFKESVSINKMKRTHTELASFLFRECDFPFGAFLMTGTCIVPPSEFTLQVNDIVDIRIDPIGTLSNWIGYKPERVS
jgi:2-dehydro-3-deoxy-D-arabinonate dehydratase